MISIWTTHTHTAAATTTTTLKDMKKWKGLRKNKSFHPFLMLFGQRLLWSFPLNQNIGTPYIVHKNYCLTPQLYFSEFSVSLIIYCISLGHFYSEVWWAIHWLQSQDSVLSLQIGVLERWTMLNHRVTNVKWKWLTAVLTQKNKSVHGPHKHTVINSAPDIHFSSFSMTSNPSGEGHPWNLHSVRLWQATVTVPSKEKGNIIPKHKWLVSNYFCSHKNKTLSHTEE